MGTSYDWGGHPATRKGENAKHTEGRECSRVSARPEVPTREPSSSPPPQCTWWGADAIAATWVGIGGLKFGTCDIGLESLRHKTSKKHSTHEMRARCAGGPRGQHTCDQQNELGSKEVEWIPEKKPHDSKNKVSYLRKYS